MNRLSNGSDIEGGGEKKDESQRVREKKKRGRTTSEKAVEAIGLKADCQVTGKNKGKSLPSIPGRKRKKRGKREERWPCLGRGGEKGPRSEKGGKDPSEEEKKEPTALKQNAHANAPAAELSCRKRRKKRRGTAQDLSHSCPAGKEKGKRGDPKVD